MFTISPRKCHDNPLVHSAAVMVAKMIELGLQLIRHHPYYLGLAPLDYFFEREREKEKLSTEDLKKNAYFAGMNQPYHLEVIKKLEALEKSQK